MDNEVLERQAQRLRQGIEECQEEAELIVNEYWGFFKIQNQKIMQASRRGDTASKLARLAPVLEKGADNRKPRLRWRLFDGTSRKITKGMNTSRVASKAVTPRQRGYTPEQLKSYCVGWETEQVLHTEAQLKPLRKTIDYLNDALRGIERTVRYAASQGDSK